MGMYGKAIAILIALSLLVLYSPMSVCAQPIGFKAPQPPQTSQQTVLSTAEGRFAFGQVSNSREDKFMLDTLTGRLWRITKKTDIGICLTSVPYRSAEGECSALPEKISDPRAKTLKEK